jgi:ferredoxin
MATPAPPAPSSSSVTVADGPRFVCRPDESVLEAMGRHGMRAIAAGCHGGGCGVCRIRVLSGAVEIRRMSRVHVSVEAEAEGVALACRTYARSDLVIVPQPLCRPTPAAAAAVSHPSPRADDP